MTDTFDLDQARAARREGREEPPTFVFGGELFELPVEIPFSVVDAFALGEFNGLKALIGESQWDKMLSHDPSIDDMNDLVEWMAREYGIEDLGKSRPSRQSSKPTGKPSKRTSKQRTGSTSAR